MKRVTVAFALAVSIATACAGQTPEQRAMVDDAIKSLDTQLANAKTTDARYSGGLIKAVIESRIATLDLSWPSSRTMRSTNRVSNRAFRLRMLIALRLAGTRSFPTA